MELELRHIAPYLPYGLTAADEWGNKREVVLSHFTYDTKTVSICHLIDLGFRKTEHKPILRPMSDLELGKMEDGRFYLWELYNTRIRPYKTFSTINDALDLHNAINRLPINHLPLTIVNQLVEWHFDVFGLIEQGLAIDINSLKSEQQ